MRLDLIYSIVTATVSSGTRRRTTNRRNIVFWKI